VADVLGESSRIVTDAKEFAALLGLAAPDAPAIIEAPRSPRAELVQRSPR